MQSSNLQYCRCCSSSIPDSKLSYSSMPSIAQLLSDNRGDALSDKLDLNILQCPECGLVQLGKGVLVSYYRNVIRSSSVSSEMMNFRHEQFDSFAMRYGLSDKCYLEVGCGRGEYLKIMAHYVADAQGIENSYEAIQECAASRLHVLHGFIGDNDLDIKKASVDAFGMFNFLEHLPEPVKFLRGIREYLKADATGIIEVPNFDIMLEGAVFSDFSSEHLSYFTAETLRTTLMLSGFSVISLTSVWHAHILSAEVRVRPLLDAQSFNNHQDCSRELIHSLLSSYSSESVAVWGAGHQSLATIVQLGLQSKIGVIIDSASTKQGKYAPASGIPIHPPEWLLQNRVDIMLINASSYSKEVCRVVLEKYPSIENVYIVDNGDLLKVKERVFEKC